MVVSHQCRLPCWTILKEGHLLQEAIPRLPNRAITGYHKINLHTCIYTLVMLAPDIAAKHSRKYVGL